MKSVLLPLGLLLWLGAQPLPNLWNTLANVSFAKKKQGNYEVEYPLFGKEVKALDGTWVRVKGYMIPLEEMRGQGSFILSAVPYSLCFFCGGAGPETVMEVEARERVPFSNRPLTLQGRLRLNANDPERLMYILEEAKAVEK